MRATVATLLSLSLAAAAGCGQSNTTGEGLPPAQLVSARAGGVVSLGDEVSLVIPPGSLAQDTPISIEKIANPPTGDADGMNGFGQAYRFLPAGTVFAQDRPAMMTMRYDGAALAAKQLNANRLQMAYFDEGLGRYVNVANQVDTTTNTITSRVEHFTVYMPVAQAAIAAGNPAPLVALQNSVPFPIRAGAPIYVRYTAQDKDPINAVTGYTGGAIAGVKLYYRRLQPMPGAWQTADMVKEPVVDPSFGGTIEDTYGFRIPETFLPTSALGMGNDIEYCAQATDNLGATTPALSGTPPCTPVGFDVTASYQAGSIQVAGPSAAPISAGFSRTYRVTGSDGMALFPIVPAAGSISISNAIGTATVSPTNATITFLAQKQNTGVLTVFQGADSSSNTITVTNGQIASLEILDTNGMPIMGSLSVPGRGNYAFDVRGLDAAGNFIHVAGVNWSAAAALGSIGGTSGVLMANNNATTANVTATLGTLSANASVTISPRYRVTANVAGLVGTTTLVNNAADAIPVGSNGSYAFSTLLPNLAAYNVAASVQPNLGACHGGPGVITGADVTVNVQCYQLRGGSVVGVPTITDNGVTLAGTNLNGYLNGSGGNARFRDTTLSVTTDGRNVYVADYRNNAIRKVVIATGTVNTLAGDGNNCCADAIFGSADGIGIAARFHGPNGLTTDGTYLYVSDYQNALIRKVHIATGTVTTVAGQANMPGHQDGIGSAAMFAGPEGLVCDGPNLYVAESLNRVIRKIVLASGVVTTLTGGVGESTHVDGPATVARFVEPLGMTTDGTYLYVADIGDRRIRRVDPATGAVTTVAGGGTTAHADGVGTDAVFENPLGITTDGTNLYVTDRDPLSHKAWISKLDLATFTATTLAGGNAAFTEGPHPHYGDQPLAIVNDGSRLILGDASNTAVRIFY